MDNAKLQRLIAIPEVAKSYASDLSELDSEHIPLERVPEFKEIMRTSSNEYDRVWAARVLAEWGDDDGYDFLESYVCNHLPSDEVLMAHRLRGYDDTNTQILMATRTYWATKASVSDTEGEKARRKIFKLVSRIITLSNTMQFEIAGLFWLVEDNGMTEYLPLLKEHLQAIIQRHEFHFWKVADCAHFLMQFDPEFVTQTLAAHGKTLADFPNK
jgi:hypothetical protein